MKCKRCACTIDDGVAVCPYCGERQFSDNSFGGNSANSYGNYYNANFNSYNEYQNNQGYSPINNKTPDLKEYLKWMLLYPLVNFIPGVGFIVYIVMCFNFAFDKTYPARSNFFKAVLICAAISAVIAVIAFICLMIFSVVIFENAEYFANEMYPEVYEEVEDVFDELRMFFN